MKTKIILIYILFISVTFAQNFNDAYRLSYQNINLDAKSLSLANSNIASLGSFSSALLNPAALATLKRDIFTFSINTQNTSNDISFLNSHKNVDRLLTSFNQVGLIMPLNKRLSSMVFAFGYNKEKVYNSRVKFDAFNNSNTSMIQDLTNFNDDLTFDLGLSYPVFNNDEYLYDQTDINGLLNQRGDVTEDGSVDNWFISGAGKVDKNLFVGATLNLSSGDYKRNRKYYEEDSKNFYNGFLDAADSNTFDFNYFYLNDIIDQKLTSWDFRIGMLYVVNRNLSVGANIKFPTTINIEEEYSIYGESDFRDSYFIANYPSSTHEYEIKTPFEFSAGFSSSFNIVSINLGIKYVDYKQLEFSDGFDESTLNDLNNEIEEVFEGVLNWNFGAEVILPYPSMKIRGGFAYLPSPYVDDPAEFDRKYITAGIGFPLTKNFIIDLAYVKGWWQNFTDNYGVDVSRTYQDIDYNKFIMSISYVIR